MVKMHPLVASLALSLLAAAPVCIAAPASPTNSTGCKPLPGDAQWPDQAAWSALNSSVSGRLSTPVAPGAVCHPERPEYNQAACTQTVLQWSNNSFHAINLVSADYNDDTCLPIAGTPCSTKGYPAYIIHAQTAQDVQAGVNFARKTGVRLNVKGTGHDFPGRSSAAGSLSIQTNLMKGLTLDQGDPRAIKYGGSGSLKVMAGERMQDVYDFTAANGVTSMGGADPGVGIGGWLQGGGHGPLTAHYGLGADHALEMEVVTPDGQIRTINEDNDSDLFWAMRGGGGSTYGVLLSATMKIYPKVSTGAYLFSYNTTANSTSFWNMFTYFSQQLPSLIDQGIMGYYNATADMPGEPDKLLSGQLSGIWIAPNKTVLEMEAILLPMETKFRLSPWGSLILALSFGVEHLDFSSAWSKSSPAGVGYGGRIASRLLDVEALTGDFDTLKAALQKASPAPWTYAGQATAGPGTHSPVGGIPGGSNAVLPAWRKAYSHSIIEALWPSANTTAMQELTDDLRENRTPALASLTPNSGAYRNEADPTEANWQQTFYGANYPRLLQLKNKWDPQGVFWCKACVGSELWDVQGNDGINNGVGQSYVRLCKTG